MKHSIIFFQNNSKVSGSVVRVHSIRLFRIISKYSVKNCLFSSLPNHVILMECQALDFLCQCTQRKLQSCRFNVTQLKDLFIFSVKERYQLKYVICIKDFNAQTITSIQFNLLYFFIYCCQHHERKTTCLDIFLLSDRQWGSEHQYLLSRFLGVSILQLLIIYRIYDYDMLTLSQ